jgi:hypothetical protein
MQLKKVAFTMYPVKDVPRARDSDRSGPGDVLRPRGHRPILDPRGTTWHAEGAE